MLNLKDKEFLNEVFKSQYDDKGKIIADSMKKSGASSIQRQPNRDGITSLAGKPKMTDEGTFKNPAFLEINYKFV